LEAIANTNSVTDTEKNGYVGFARTVLAQQLMALVVMYNESGIRIDVADPDNLGPIVGRSAALAAVSAMLDDAASDLNNAGDGFAFSVPSGFAGFKTPASFRKVNRALAARAAVYRGNYGDALTHLSGSFLDMNGSVDLGAYMTFSTGAGDLTNPLFLPQNNTGEIRLAHPAFVADSEAGDARAAKATMRTSPAGSANLSSTHDVWIYQSNVDPVTIIRNEELMLISAEAKIQQNDLSGAVGDIDAVRSKAGLGPYTGAMDKDALINQMLRERRYSLWCEGHRWEDLRRNNKLSTLPKDRPDDLVHTSLPVPPDDDF
jgi:hypothetical protein